MPQEDVIEFTADLALAWAHECLNNLDGTEGGLRLAAGAIRQRIELAYKLGKHNSHHLQPKTTDQPS
jgi:hypothetical protein